MISILAFLAVIFATYYVYKTAKDTNRNAVGWAVATFAVGLGFQIVFPVIIGIVITLIMSASGNSAGAIQEFFQAAGLIINLVCLALSFVGIFLIARRVSGFPEDKISDAPPSPPDFNEKP